MFLGEEIAQGREYSETTAREVDEEVKKILTDAYQDALGILREHRRELDRVVDLLIEKEEITGAEVARIIEEKKK